MKTLINLPPVLFLLFSGLLFVLPPIFKVQMPLILPFSLAVIAIFIGLLSFVQCRLAKVNIHPINLSQTSTLLQTGIYRFSRNPMYLSLVLLLLAQALWRGGASGFPGVLLLAYWLQHGQIKREERYLSAKFGAQYQRYCQRTRRWL